MDCNIIVDLLPLYEEGLCRKETKRIVEEHLKECDECNKIREEMFQKIDVFEMDSLELQNNVFWEQYYGQLIKNIAFKGVIVYIVFMVLALLIF